MSFDKILKMAKSYETMVKKAQKMEYSDDEGLLADPITVLVQRFVHRNASVVEALAALGMPRDAAIARVIIPKLRNVLTQTGVIKGKNLDTRVLSSIATNLSSPQAKAVVGVIAQALQAMPKTQEKKEEAPDLFSIMREHSAK